MSAPLYLITLCLLLGTVLLVFAMRYFATIQRAKARLASEDAFRQLAEKSAAAQAETASAVAAIQATLADAMPRLTAIEKILKDVG